MNKPSKKKVTALVAAGAAFLAPAAGLAVTAGSAGAGPYAYKGPVAQNPAKILRGGGNIRPFGACTYAPTDGYVYVGQYSGNYYTEAVWSPSTDCWFISSGAPGPGYAVWGELNATKAGTPLMGTLGNDLGTSSNSIKTGWINSHQSYLGANVKMTVKDGNYNYYYMPALGL